MKPRKGKTMSKAGGYVCICDKNTSETGLRYNRFRRQSHLNQMNMLEFEQQFFKPNKAA